MRPLDGHWLGPLPASQQPSARGARGSARRRSLYLTMRDRTRVALDLYLPRVDARCPTIVRPTRYLRSLRAKPGLDALGLAGLFDLYASTRARFVGEGYAWIDLDARGTGASTGVWQGPWAPDEVADYAEVVSYVVSQPWSSGLVGALGISYDGTAADMLATTGHPAVRAVAPLFASYDVYADVAFPGGIQLAWFTRTWSDFNRALDEGRFGDAWSSALYLIGLAGLASPSRRGLERAFAPLAKGGEAAFKRRVGATLDALFQGVRVPDQGGPAPTASELAARAQNADVHAQALLLRGRDQVGLSRFHPHETIDLMSPHAHAAAARTSGVAFYSYSGYGDGAYQHAAVKRHLTLATPGSRLTLGPWVPSGKLALPAFGIAEPTGFDHDGELLQFFEQHLRPERPLARVTDGAPVHYFSMVENRWRRASTWPPPETRRHTYYLGAGRLLTERPPAPDERFDVHHEPGSTGTGHRSRWRSLFSLVPGDYPDRAARGARLLVYRSAPLARDVRVAGHPEVELFVGFAGEADGDVFVYLEDEAPDGRVALVTEGVLASRFRERVGPEPCRSAVATRRFHREDARPLEPSQVATMAFDLLPIAWLFEAGHRLRLAIAGADADHFAVCGERTLQVYRSPERASRLHLPVLVG